MSTKIMTAVIIVLALVIVVLAWLLWATPASGPTIKNPTPQATSTAAKPATEPSTTQPQPQPLDKKIKVTSPAPNSTVGHTITVLGRAPGPWFFEAQFPIKVRDDNDNVIGSAPASAEGNWQTTGLVQFKAIISLDPKFKGHATLVLLKDNPSGLPQNDDSLEVPIVVQ